MSGFSLDTSYNEILVEQETSEDVREINEVPDIEVEMAEIEEENPKETHHPPSPVNPESCGGPSATGHSILPSTVFEALSKHTARIDQSFESAMDTNPSISIANISDPAAFQPSQLKTLASKKLTRSCENIAGLPNSESKRNLKKQNPILSGMLDNVVPGDGGELFRKLINSNAEEVKIPLKADWSAETDQNGIKAEPKPGSDSKQRIIHMETNMSNHRHSSLGRVLVRAAGYLIDRIRKATVELVNDPDTRPFIPLALSPLVDNGLFNIVFPDAKGPPYFYIFPYINQKGKEEEKLDEELAEIGNADYLPPEVEYLGRLVIPPDYSEGSYVNKIGGFPLNMTPGSDMVIDASEMLRGPSEVQKKCPQLSELLGLDKIPPKVLMDNPILTSMVGSPKGKPTWKDMINLVGRMYEERERALKRLRKFLLLQDQKYRTETKNEYLAEKRKSLLEDVHQILHKNHPLLSNFWKEFEDIPNLQIPRQPVQMTVYSVTGHSGPNTPPTSQNPSQRDQTVDENPDAPMEAKAEKESGVEDTATEGDTDATEQKPAVDTPTISDLVQETEATDEVTRLMDSLFSPSESVQQRESTRGTSPVSGTSPETPQQEGLSSDISQQPRDDSAAGPSQDQPGESSRGTIIETEQHEVPHGNISFQQPQEFDYIAGPSQAVPHIQGLTVQYALDRIVEDILIQEEKRIGSPPIDTARRSRIELTHPNLLEMLKKPVPPLPHPSVVLAKIRRLSEGEAGSSGQVVPSAEAGSPRQATQMAMAGPSRPVAQSAAAGPSGQVSQIAAAGPSRQGSRKRRMDESEQPRAIGILDSKGQLLTPDMIRNILIKGMEGMANRHLIDEETVRRSVEEVMSSYHVCAKFQKRFDLARKLVERKTDVEARRQNILSTPSTSRERPFVVDQQYLESILTGGTLLIHPDSGQIISLQQLMELDLPYVEVKQDQATGSFVLHQSQRNPDTPHTGIALPTRVTHFDLAYVRKLQENPRPFSRAQRSINQSARQASSVPSTASPSQSSHTRSYIPAATATGNNVEAFYVQQHDPGRSNFQAQRSVNASTQQRNANTPASRSANSRDPRLTCTYIPPVEMNMSVGYMQHEARRGTHTIPMPESQPVRQSNKAPSCAGSSDMQMNEQLLKQFYDRQEEIKKQQDKEKPRKYKKGVSGKSKENQGSSSGDTRAAKQSNEPSTSLPVKSCTPMPATETQTSSVSEQYNQQYLDAEIITSNRRANLSCLTSTPMSPFSPVEVPLGLRTSRHTSEFSTVPSRLGEQSSQSQDLQDMPVVTLLRPSSTQPQLRRSASSPICISEILVCRRQNSEPVFRCTPIGMPESTPVYLPVPSAVQPVVVETKKNPRRIFSQSETTTPDISVPVLSDSAPMSSEVQPNGTINENSGDLPSQSGTPISDIPIGQQIKGGGSTTDSASETEEMQ